MTEPMTKFSCEMRVVAEATSVGDFAQRLAGAQQRPSMQKMRGVFQTKRLLAMLRPCPDADLKIWPVDKRVGNVRNKGPELALAV
jgi:hypothetical protein